MGGYGSGRRGWKPIAEQYRAIDVNHLNRAGWLKAGYSGGCEWRKDGERTALIDLRSTGSQLELRYRFRRSGEDWSDVCERIRLTSTPCGFGGSTNSFKYLS